MSAKSTKPINEEQFVWEFGGVIGTYSMIIGLPLGTYYLTACAFYGNLLLPKTLSVTSIHQDTISPLFEFIHNQCSIDWISFLLYSFWLFIQILADRTLKGEIVYGQPIPEMKGKRLKYVMNGWKAWIFTHLVVFLLLIRFNNLSELLISKMFSIMSVAQLYAFAISILAYLIGYQSGLGCRLSGNFIYDFFMGYSRVPRIGEFDLKLFCEARPGLQLWIVIDFIFLYHHYQMYEVIDYQMTMIFVMQWVYICDYFWFEDAILTTMDLIHDKFGFMLAFGDLVWVPWTYTLQIQCLYFYYQRNGINESTKNDANVWLIVLFIFFLLGYVIFRQSNLQKHRFRQGEGDKIWGKEVEYIQTKRGTKLLMSGWWKVGRHMNYTGDWMMSAAQSMCCDNFSFCAAPSFILVYFNPIYFAILLVHRESRDNLRCKMKYGNDWNEYCNKVPARMIPYIY